MLLKTTVTIAALCAIPASADVTVRADPGVSGAVSSPARDYFGLGFHLGATAGYDVVRFFEVGAHAGYDFLSRNATSPLDGPGSVLALGPAVRLHAPWADSSYVPWVEASLLYARTGELDRLAVSVTAGFHFALPGHKLFVGPWIGITQVFHLADAATYPTQDATILSGGVAVDLSVFRAVVEPVVAAPPRDSDGDGVADADDACPNVAGLAAFRGCPDPDPDHDGVLGAADLCPNQPEDHDGFQDEDGCPDLDDDGDGVPDVDDACPRLPGPPETHGCPDRDGDGISDNDDRCPTVKGVASEQGCPLYKDVRVTEVRIEILQKIFFAFGTTTILPRSFPLLDEVVKALGDRSALCSRVEGHTDSKGGADANLRLSQGRADSVRTYLMAHGIAPSRLGAKGYGASLPRDDNSTADGRENNRRVEFVIVPCEVSAP